MLRIVGGGPEHRNIPFTVAVRQRLQHDAIDDSVNRCSRSYAGCKRGGRQEQHSFSAAPGPPCLRNDHAAL